MAELATQDKRNRDNPINNNLFMRISLSRGHSLLESCEI